MNQLRCLIIEPSSILRRLLRQTLEPIGYHCAEAANGAQAFETVLADAENNQHFSLILLDWFVPALAASELLPKIRALPFHGEQSPRVVICSVESRVDIIVAAVRAGADEFIMKPFDGDILRGKLALLALPSGVEPAR